MAVPGIAVQCALFLGLVLTVTAKGKGREETLPMSFGVCPSGYERLNWEFCFKIEQTMTPFPERNHEGCYVIHAPEEKAKVFKKHVEKGIKDNMKKLNVNKLWAFSAADTCVELSRGKYKYLSGQQCQKHLALLCVIRQIKDSKRRRRALTSDQLRSLASGCNFCSLFP